MSGSRIAWAAAPALALLVAAAPAPAAWAPEPIPSTAGALPPVLSLAAAPDGRVLALFEGFRQDTGRFTGIAVRDPAGAWTRAADLPGVGWGGARLLPAGGPGTTVVARRVTGFGRFHRARHELVWAAGRTDGSVGRLRRLARSAGAPAAASGPDGTALVAWTPQGGGPVRVRVRRPGGAFGPARRLGRSGADVVAAAVGAAGERVVLWSGGGSLRARVKRPGGAWGPVERIPGAGILGGGARVVVAPDGRVLVAWASAVTREGRPVRLQVRAAVRTRRGRWHGRRLVRATLSEDALSGDAAAVPLYAGGRLLVAFTGVAPGRTPAIVIARLGPLGRVLLRATIATGGVLDDAASAVTDARVALTWSGPRGADGGVHAFAAWWTPDGTTDPTDLAPPGEVDLAGGRITVVDIVHAVLVRGLVQDGAGALTAASDGPTDDSVPPARSLRP